MILGKQDNPDANVRRDFIKNYFFEKVRDYYKS